ncbi:MAG: YkgJ family cysteine cluster protein [Pseudodesulfovibrio sp.]
MSPYHYFTGLFRRFRSFVLKREVEIIGQCRLCGSCCHDILLHDGDRFIKREKQFKKLCKSNSTFTRFRIIKPDDEGHLTFSCSFKDNNNNCTSYEDRLPLCKEYPSKGFYYHGGWLRADCGFSYKHVSFHDIYMRRTRSKIPEFSEVLRNEQEQTDK